MRSLSGRIRVEFLPMISRLPGELIVRAVSGRISAEEPPYDQLG